MIVLKWITLKKFCELTHTDIELVKKNIKEKKGLHKFSVLKARTFFINYYDWLFSVTKDLRFEESNENNCI